MRRAWVRARNLRDRSTESRAGGSSRRGGWASRARHVFDICRPHDEWAGRGNHAGLGGSRSGRRHRREHRVRALRHWRRRTRQERCGARGPAWAGTGALAREVRPRARSRIGSAVRVAFQPPLWPVLAGARFRGRRSRRTRPAFDEHRPGKPVPSDGSARHRSRLETIARPQGNELSRAGVRPPRKAPCRAVRLRGWAAWNACA